MANTYMFDNYQNLDPDYIPDNIHRWHLPPDGVRNIVRGTTPEHFIHVPFKLDSDVDNLLITYKQRYTFIEKTLDDVYTKENDKDDIIYFQFTEEETNSFKAIPNEPCKIQMRVLLKNHDVIASDTYEVEVLDVLNDKELANELK